MDLAAELKKRLEYRQKVHAELTLIDSELLAVIALLQPEPESQPQPTPATFTGTGNGRPANEYTNRLIDVTPVDNRTASIRRRHAAQGHVTADQMEAFLVKRIDKAVDVNDLVTKFGMKRNSATTRLWILARDGRIVKTGPGTYYVTAPRDMAHTG